MRPTAGAAGRHPARHGGGKLRLKAEQLRRLFARSTLLRKRRYFSWSLVSAKSPMCIPRLVSAVFLFRYTETSAVHCGKLDVSWVGAGGCGEVLVRNL